MFKPSVTFRKRLMFENCEQRLLLTDASWVDSSEPVDSVERNEIRVMEPAAIESHEITNEPAERLVVAVAVELVVSHEDVYESGDGPYPSTDSGAGEPDLVDPNGNQNGGDLAQPPSP